MMKTVYGWLKPLLWAAMLASLVSCATVPPYIPTDSTVGNMSVKQARNLLDAGLREGYVYDRSAFVKIASVRVTSKRLVVTDKNGKQSTFIFSELPQISRNTEYLGAIDLAGKPALGGWNIKETIDALYVLQQSAMNQKKEVDAYDASFAASLADYRHKAASNHALPEEAIKYKVQAEGAVRDKAFDDAADYYAAALKVAPWWPAGHFNRALVEGEVGEYKLAQRAMNYYLQLVPGASNARAAQDKIYEWERLGSK